MERHKITLGEYLNRIPEQYRILINIVGKFKGKRSRIIFYNKLCGCKKEYELGSFIKRKNFDMCKSCYFKFAKKQNICICQICNKKFVESNILKHELSCKSKFDCLIEGVDYVICYICGFHAKSLRMHVVEKHNLSIDEYKKEHQIICLKLLEIYNKQNKYNANWINRAKERGDDLTEYKKKLSEAVSRAIMSNQEERKRRSIVMANVNKSDIMRKKSSETAIKTSARKDIQNNRSKQLKKWRDNNPEDFYNKCTFKMLNCWRSKPELLLFDIVKSHHNYNFKQNQVVKSNKFISKSKRKQIDIGDKSKRMYIEYDGPLHFLNKKINKLDIVRKKDQLLDLHIIRHGWTLIRISYDQFSYKKSDYGFKKGCIDRIFAILDNPTSGVHYIGDVYDV